MPKYTGYRGGTFSPEAARSSALRLYTPNYFYRKLPGPAQPTANPEPTMDQRLIDFPQYAITPGELTGPGSGAAYTVEGSDRPRYITDPATGQAVAVPVYEYFDPYTGKYLPTESSGD
jgi:hypothetical protein